MNSYRRGLRNGVLVNPKLFILEKVNLAPPTIGWSTWANLVNLVKNLYYLVRVATCWAGLQALDVALLYKKNKKEEGPVGASPVAAPLPKLVSF